MNLEELEVIPADKAGLQNEKGNSLLLQCILLSPGQKIPSHWWTKENLHIANESAWTPLTAMIYQHRLGEIPEGLLSQETLNHKDPPGKTPLHCAISWDYPAETLYLLQHGANPHLPDNSGQTSIQLAQTMPTIAPILKKFLQGKTKKAIQQKTPLDIS